MECALKITIVISILSFSFLIFYSIYYNHYLIEDCIRDKVVLKTNSQFEKVLENSYCEKHRVLQVVLPFVHETEYQRIEKFISESLIDEKGPIRFYRRC